MRSLRRQLSAQVTADPKTVIDRELFGRVHGARRGLARSREGFGRLRRPIAARRDQRVAIGDVQFLPLA